MLLMELLLIIFPPSRLSDKYMHMLNVKKKSQYPSGDVLRHELPAGDSHVDEVGLGRR